MFLATIVLMIITSAGSSGYFSSKFQAAILPAQEIAVKVSLLEQEKQKLELRKNDIDKQISNLPPDMVKGRTKLINNFKSEIEHVNSRLIEIDKELPQLKIEEITKTSHSGPITYISKALNTSVESAMGIIIGLIIFVFDPLAISLILAGNYLNEKQKKKPQEKIIEPLVEEETFEEEIQEEVPEEIQEEVSIIEEPILEEEVYIETPAIPSIVVRETVFEPTSFIEENLNITVDDHQFTNGKEFVKISFKEEINIAAADEIIQENNVHRSSLEDILPGN